MVPTEPAITISLHVRWAPKTSGYCARKQSAQLLYKKAPIPFFPGPVRIPGV